MSVFLVFCVLCLLVPVTRQSGRHAETYSRTVKYDNDVVVRCPDKDDHLTKLVMAHDGVDVWKVDPSGQVDMRMNGELLGIVQDYIPACHLLISSVEAHIQEAEADMLSAEQKMNIWEQAFIQELGDETHKPIQTGHAYESESFESPEKWFESYHDLASIQKWYHKLATDNPSLVRYVPSIGQTVQGRDLIAVHITASSASERPRIYIQCLIHAREWISGSTCMYIANRIVTQYGKDDKVTKLLNAAEVMIVPVVNPDGYAHSWEANRLWRKNRAKYPKMSCVGVDLNRNYPTGWGKQQEESAFARDRSCAEIYEGPCPFSENEVKHVSNYFRKNAPVVGSIDFHSFGQLVLRPWGYTGSVSAEEETMSTIGQELAQELSNVNGKKYVSQKGYDLYRACGVATDWFFSDDAASTNKGYRAAAFTIELRDKGTYGFLLPRQQIAETAQEAFSAFIHLADTAHNNPITYEAVPASQKWEDDY